MFPLPSWLKTVPLPCVSAAFADKDTVFALCVFTAFAAEDTAFTVCFHYHRG